MSFTVFLEGVLECSLPKNCTNSLSSKNPMGEGRSFEGRTDPFGKQEPCIAMRAFLWALKCCGLSGALCWVQGRLSQKQIAWNWFVLAIGVACAVSGTTSSLLAIMRQSSA